jgi:hypothetical protein
MENNNHATGQRRTSKQVLPTNLVPVMLDNLSGKGCHVGAHTLRHTCDSLSPSDNDCGEQIVSFFIFIFDVIDFF